MGMCGASKSTTAIHLRIGIHVLVIDPGMLHWSEAALKTINRHRIGCRAREQAPYVVIDWPYHRSVPVDRVDPLSRTIKLGQYDY